jgi:glycosyltransferase involved in cell wall biosynthesis
LDPDNRVDLLIDATAELRRWDSRCQLVLVGAGSQKAGLESLAGKRGIGSAVRFLGACYQEEELAPWALNSVAMAYPTNIGLSLLHAFGYALPVITGDNPASQNPEIEALRDGWNGLLFREGSVADLALKCRRVMEETELRDRLGANALETVLTRYTIENMVQGFLDATRLVDGKRRSVVTEPRTEGGA